MSKITTIRDDVKGQRENFTYDPLDRLISAVPSPMTGVTTTLDYTETYSYTPIGNFISKAGVSQYYSGTKPHAVTSLSNGASFTYDANGNMTQRVELSGTQWVTYTQAWDIDNRMAAITSSLGYTATYAYDADGQRVNRADATGMLLVIGLHFEVQASAGISTSYYFFGSQRVAMRQNSAVYWLHGDHLGSASLTTNVTGAAVSELRYFPFGETRWYSGTTPTDRLYTGQRIETSIGLYDYNARMYSPSLGRFISADSIVPRAGNPLDFNRYAYAYDNPLKYTDPTGHFVPLLFIGGAILLGAIIGGGVGATVSVVEQQREADAANKEMQLDVDRTARTALVGAGVGALGGAIVGVGGVAFAAAGGAATLASSSAGAATIATAGAVNAAGSVAGYAASAGTFGSDMKFDDAAISAGWGFVNGAANRAIMGKASGSLNEMKGGGSPASSGFFGGATTTGEYVSRQFVHGQSIDATTSIANFALGASVGVLNSKLPSSSPNPSTSLIGLYTNPSWAKQQALYQYSSALLNGLRSAFGYWASTGGVSTLCSASNWCQ